MPSRRLEALYKIGTTLPCAGLDVRDDSTGGPGPHNRLHLRRSARSETRLQHTLNPTAASTTLRSRLRSRLVSYIHRVSCGMGREYRHIGNKVHTSRRLERRPDLGRSDLPNPANRAYPPHQSPHRATNNHRSISLPRAAPPVGRIIVHVMSRRTSEEARVARRAPAAPSQSPRRRRCLKRRALIAVPVSTLPVRAACASA